MLPGKVPDIFYFLQSYYQGKRLEHPRFLANLRIAELLADGQSFLSSEITPYFTDPAEIGLFGSNLQPSLVANTLEFYEQARVATEQRDQALVSYVETAIEKGDNPDTNPDFWQHWQEPPFPSLPKTSFSQLITSPRALPYLVLGVLVFLGLLLLAIIIKLIRIFRRRAA